MKKIITKWTEYTFLISTFFPVGRSSWEAKIGLKIWLLIIWPRLCPDTQLANLSVTFHVINLTVFQYRNPVSEFWFLSSQASVPPSRQCLYGHCHLSHSFSLLLLWLMEPTASRECPCFGEVTVSASDSPSCWPPSQRREWCLGREEVNLPVRFCWGRRCF